MLSFLFLIPFLLGVISIFIKSFPADRLMRVVLGLSALAVLLLLWGGEMTLPVPLFFLGEPISLSLSTTALLLCLFLLGVLGVLLHLNRVKSGRILSRFNFLILNFSLCFGFLAFFSNQFMIRYIALELVGLLAAASMRQSLTPEAFKRFEDIFLTLRIGDICLLSSILLILPYSGNLVIPEMIAAAEVMPLAQRSWVVLGFILAVMVKMGVFPFSGWQKRARATMDTPAFWTTDFLMPALGMYLLYRVQPLIDSDPLFQVAVPILAAGVIVVRMAISYFDQRPYVRFIHLGSVMNAFILLMAAYSTGPALRVYFLGLLLHRLGLYLQAQEILPKRWGVMAFFPVALNLAILVPHLNLFPTALTAGWVALTVLTFFWDRHLSTRVLSPQATKACVARDWRRPVAALAEGLYQHLEINLFSNGVVRLAGAFTGLADWVQNSVEMGFDRVWTGLGKLLKVISTGGLNVLEIGADKKTIGWVDDMMQSVDAREQDVQSRSLRQDLIWIPILMLVILGFLSISQGG
ncbi:MAG: hypothetical protein H0S82_03265 [Anaerolineaceae bacterium]|nr:hypothetical protein [Anaerolineaceae bacterium]